MSLQAGHKLGPYEIIEQAGAGGMGEVYKAKDTRLDRIVAIKVLPPNIAMNADIRQRFEREAKAISSLNHPNICTLHDIGNDDNTDYLVMEYLEGETLSDHLAKGPMTYDEVLHIATQIATALDTAHKQGLVHRDLKPSNVMLTKEGAKLMDFGLAKLQLEGGPVQGMTEVTRTTPLTGAGTIIGTMQYMAPEQLEGKDADARSDIFAFGAMLYEMSTGKRAFEGASQATLIAAIIEREPTSISVIIPTTPPIFERLVKKCLNKDPEKRWQSASDLCDELRWISHAGSSVGLPAHLSKRRKVKFTIARLVGAIFIVTTLILGYLLFSQKPEEKFTNRFSISPSNEVEEIRTVNWSRISPNGRYIAFRARDTLGVSLLWIRPMNSLEPYPLRGTENIGRHFWSPDSKYLAYFKANQLYKIPVAGGPPQLICDAYGADGNWGSGGYILFDGASTDTLKYVSANGGAPQYATKIDTSKGERSSAWPWFLPDGEHFIYTMYTRKGRQVRVGSLESDEYTVLFNEEAMQNIVSRVEYCKLGYILYNKDNLLLAQKFDPNSFELSGETIPVAQGIDLSGNASTFGTSDNGVLLYQYTPTSTQSELIWFDRKGLELEKVGESDTYRDISLSPDNNKVAFGLFDEQGQNEDIWIRDFKRNIVSRLTFDKPHNVLPIWSPDGRYIAYAEAKDGGFSTKYKRSDGQGTVYGLNKLDSIPNGPMSWPNDSEIVVVYSVNSLNLGKYNIEDSTFTPLVNKDYNEIGGSLSNNGRYLLFISNESGRNEIYVQELAENGGRWQVSNEGGFSPSWSADNKEIYYTKGNDLMFVEVNMTGGKFEIGLPEKMFTKNLNYSGVANAYRYAVANDRQRILMNVDLNQTSDDNIIVVQNWLAEIEEK